MRSLLVESRLARASASWSRFWFTPADPTVLGAIRILTGLITFYTLVVYCWDLADIVGPNAWLDLELRREQYRDAPVVRVPFGWNDTNYGPPASEDEKTYQLEYIKKWGMPPPLPYPKTTEEAKGYDEYRARWGIDPRQLMSKGQAIWSVWFHVTDPFWMVVVHGGIMLCSFMFMIGLGTRLTSVLTWVGALSYVHRAPVSVFGVDTMMAVLLLYLMIGPSGAALSVDRLIAKWWARRRGLPVPPLTPSISANLAMRLIQIHACIIYGAAGLAKLQGASWWTGVAPWGTIANFEYAPLQFSIYIDFLEWLAKTRWVFELAMTGGAIGTLVFEIGYPFMIWRPAWRTTWLWMAVLLHLGIGMFMGLRTFSLIMLAFNLAFVSPETVRWALARFGPKAKVPAESTTPPVQEPTDHEKPKPTAIVRQERPVIKGAATHVKRKH